MIRLLRPVLRPVMRVLSLRTIVIVAALSVVVLVLTRGTWVWIGVTNDQYSQLDRRLDSLSSLGDVSTLLNSTRQAVIYGENTQLVHQLPVLVHQNVEAHQTLRPRLDDTLARFRAGETEFWSSALHPGTEPMMLASFQWFYHAVSIYDRQSREMGMARWGLKNPMVCPSMIDRLAALLKAAKFLFIYRNPHDVARSAKARKFYADEAGLRDLARQWRAHVDHVRRAAAPHTMIIEYEPFVADPGPVLQRIEQFTGITGIDPGVMRRKINTFIGDVAQGHAPDGYIAPAALTEAETAIVVEATGIPASGLA